MPTQTPQKNIDNAKHPLFHRHRPRCVTPYRSLFSSTTDSISRELFLLTTCLPFECIDSCGRNMANQDEQPAEMLLRLGKPSLLPDSTEVGHMEKLSRMLLVRACFANCDKPVSVSFQSDSAPPRTSERRVSDMGENRRRDRRGEHILQRRCARNVDEEMTALVDEPLRLFDEAVSTHLRAARKLLLYPWHVCFDGALFESLSKPQAG